MFTDVEINAFRACIDVAVIVLDREAENPGIRQQCRVHLKNLSQRLTETLESVAVYQKKQERPVNNGA
jgi:hypothetical protein